MATETDSMTAHHLVFFLHGHNGHPNDLSYISSEVEKRYPDRVLVYSLKSYIEKTNDGIDNAGRLAAREIQDHVSTLKSQGVVVRHVSFVGHSLGGLVARYVIALLYTTKFFDGITPMNFTTFATPHLGIKKITTGSIIRRSMDGIFNLVAPVVAGRSGSQLFLLDDYKGRPLLVAMAEEDSDYCRALQLFPYKSLYANVVLDYLVPYFTASISASNLVYSHRFIPDYEPVVLNEQPPHGDNTAITSSPEDLRLDDNQLFIIDSLNKLHWNKYPVHIHGHWTTHSAILVFKVPNIDTCEGKVVVRHYNDHFVQGDSR